jgi:hypothetical protein
MLDLGMLTAKDWADFEETHPSAMAFLVARAVKNEITHLVRLNRSGALSTSDRKRLEEFKQIFGEEALPRITAEACRRAT